MLIKPIVITLSLFATTVFAQTGSTPSPAPPEAVFESEGLVETKMFVPEKLMNGLLYNVGPQAENDGLLNTYFIASGGRTFEVTTGIALRTRIRELLALNKLRGMSKTDAFTKAMATAGKKKLESAAGIVRDPVAAIKRVPQGASRFFGRIGESMKGGKSEGEGNTVQSITGVEKAKVALAAKLGVSPFSTNEELQEQLTNAARAMAGGGFIVNAATAAVGGAAGDVLSVLNLNQNLQQTLATATASDLRIINRKKLFALGVTREIADEFLMHPWYSPWHETIIIDALATIDLDPTVFLERACRALTEQDANYFQRLAQILARYHKTKAPLSAIRLEDGRVCAMDSTGILVVPLSCDYAIWNENAAARVEAFSQLPQSRGEIKGLALWVDGSVSDRAAQELKNRKVDLATGVLVEPSKPKTP
ncbi:MAG TPA: hypothetical protein VNP98_02855 [Chthoniobacterales bacterium]|nr:hypothetical protein [Chthoniobacterales bacterium]